MMYCNNVFERKNAWIQRYIDNEGNCNIATSLSVWFFDSTSLLYITRVSHDIFQYVHGTSLRASLCIN